MQEISLSLRAGFSLLLQGRAPCWLLALRSTRDIYIYIFDSSTFLGVLFPVNNYYTNTCEYYYFMLIVTLVCTRFYHCVTVFSLPFPSYSPTELGLFFGGQFAPMMSNFSGFTYMGPRPFGVLRGLVRGRSWFDRLRRSTFTPLERRGIRMHDADADVRSSPPGAPLRASAPAGRPTSAF